MRVRITKSINRTDVFPIGDAERKAQEIDLKAYDTVCLLGLKVARAFKIPSPSLFKTVHLHHDDDSEKSNFVSGKAFDLQFKLEEDNHDHYISPSVWCESFLEQGGKSNQSIHIFEGYHFTYFRQTKENEEEKIINN